MSPDGRSLYAAAYESDAAAHLLRDPAGGRLTWDGCLSNDGSGICGDLPEAPLEGAAHVAANPDGRSVYVGSVLAGMLARFTRELPVPPGPSPVPPPPATDQVAPTISRLAHRQRRFRFMLSEPATVRITIDRRRKPARRRTITRPGSAGLNRLRVKLPRGAYRARFSAVDAAGNRSRTATLRFTVARRPRAS